MLIKAIALSAAAGLLITSAAQAQSAQTYTDTTHATQKAPQNGASTSVNPGMSTTWSTTTPSASAATTYSSDVAATYPASTSTALSMGGDVQLVTNMPVADTPENRSRYTPLSRAGRATSPRGN